MCVVFFFHCFVLSTVCVEMCTVLYYCQRVSIQLQLTKYINIYQYRGAMDRKVISHHVHVMGLGGVSPCIPVYL